MPVRTNLQNGFKINADKGYFIISSDISGDNIKSGDLLHIYKDLDGNEYITNVIGDNDVNAIAILPGNPSENILCYILKYTNGWNDINTKTYNDISVYTWNEVKTKRLIDSR